jgi:hypothetical protein
MPNIGLIYNFAAQGVIDNINKIIEDYQQKAIEILGKTYVTAHRDILPTDSIIGGPSPDNWSTTATGGASVKVNNIAVATKVEVDQCVLIIGWYANKNLGPDSRFYLEINEKIRAPVPAEAVYLSRGHILLTPKLLQFLKNNDRINCWIFNGLGAGNNVDGQFFPIGIVYGEGGVLGVD